LQQRVLKQARKQVAAQVEGSIPHPQLTALGLCLGLLGVGLVISGVLLLTCGLAWLLYASYGDPVQARDVVLGVVLAILGLLYVLVPLVLVYVATSLKLEAARRRASRIADYIRGSSSTGGAS